MKSITPRKNRWLVALGAFAFTFVVFCGAVGDASGEEKGADLSIRGEGQHPLSLTLVWYDTYRLLPGSFRSMAWEVIRIYDEVGVDIAWEPGREDFIDGVDLDPLRVDVVLLPTHPTSWGLKADAMGVATHRQGVKGSVYVFFPALIRTLALDPIAGDLNHPRARKMVSRGMARVITHELLHVMAPQYPHTEGGLMNQNMSRRYLEKPLVHLDDVSARVLRGRIFGKAHQSAVASRDGERESKMVVLIESPLQIQN